MQMLDEQPHMTTGVCVMRYVQEGNRYKLGKVLSMHSSSLVLF